MQDRIAHLLSITFNRIKVAVLRSYLNLNEADLKSFVASKNGWSIQGDIVTFPKSATTKSSSANRTQELVSLVALSPMLRSVTVGF